MITNETELRGALEIMRAMARDGTMKPKRFRSAIAAIGLTQQESGEYFGHSKRTGQSWALGTSPIPLAVQWCLEFMVAKNINAKGFEK
jgi:hypothetical protein